MKIEIKEDKSFSKSIVEPICECCSNEMLKDFQKSFNVKDLRIGDYVKQRFTGINNEDDLEYVENLWLFITEIDVEIKGILDSSPVLISDMHRGDTIYVTPSDLCGHMKGPRL